MIWGLTISYKDKMSTGTDIRYLRRQKKVTQERLAVPRQTISKWEAVEATAEQQNRFGLRGYAAAYVLPKGFEP